jgi:anhydro-N-acetylmuramic acid kinase
MTPFAALDRDELVVIGLMSGTSADGIDACVARIHDVEGRPVPELLIHRTYPHDEQLAPILLSLGEVGASLPGDRVEWLARAHFALGTALGRASLAIVAEAGLSTSDIHLVGSHGQTVRHVPRAEPIGTLPARATLQIGEPGCIAELVRVPVVSDFRVRDVAAGGLGAPLVPYVDRLLLERRGTAVAAQNFGGIGNVTHLPGDPAKPLTAFDTGPGNMVMDGLMRRITGGVEGYDRDGARARQGRANRSILEQLLADPFFALAPPRNAGREQYGREFLDRFWQLCDKLLLAVNDRVATATAFTAAATADAYRRFLLPRGPLSEVIVSGGGALNPALMEMLSSELPGITVSTSDVHGIPPLAKEALAFAVLAYETVRGRSANCPEATGARRPVLLGKLTLG